MEIPVSLGAMLRHSCTTYADRTANLVPSGKSFEPVTYRELFQKVRRWASGVRALGLARGDRVCILSENCPEWAWFDWACQTMGVITVPIYPTLPAEQATYIVGNCGAKLVACGDAEQMKKVSSLHGLRSILLRGPENSIEQVASEAALIAEDEWDRHIDGAAAQDIATIIYTSGTTGIPKGVMLTHRGCVWVGEAVGGKLGIGCEDVFLSFLPLSHIYERADDHFLPISLGAAIAYSKSLATLSNDMLNARPTVILCVPRFLEATMGRIIDASKKMPSFRKRLFEMTLKQGTARSHGKIAPLYPLLDRLVGTKIRERLGGRCRLLVSGGAALPRHVADFYAAFGIKIIQGYGLTETTGGIAVNSPIKKNRPETAGQILDGMECRFAADGEIQLRGPAIMAGYYNLPEETAATLDADGWFSTGDIGEFDGEYLKITDRKKDLLVLGNGKNVAPQPIENLIKGSPLIAEAVVLGDDMDACVALVIPDFAALRERMSGGAGSSSIPASDADLAALPEAKAAIKAEIDKINKTLAGYEMVKRFALLDKPFTIESGELTPSLKVKRKVVAERNAELIKTLA
jgi:long-chain acyl-CoA synthetase